MTKQRSSKPKSLHLPTGERLTAFDRKFLRELRVSRINLPAAARKHRELADWMERILRLTAR
jgi:hypothetical protein